MGLQSIDLYVDDTSRSPSVSNKHGRAMVFQEEGHYRVLMMKKLSVFRLMEASVGLYVDCEPVEMQISLGEGYGEAEKILKEAVSLSAVASTLFKHTSQRSRLIYPFVQDSNFFNELAGKGFQVDNTTARMGATTVRLEDQCYIVETTNPEHPYFSFGLLPRAWDYTQRIHLGNNNSGLGWE